MQPNEPLGETAIDIPVSNPRAAVFLHPGRDRRVAFGHPWVFSNEVRMDEAALAIPAGSLVTVRRGDGKPLGIGSFNPHTLIAVRLFTADVAHPVDRAFLIKRLQVALRLRERLFGTPFYRLVHAEADGLPGLVVDRFGDGLVVQANTAGMEALTPLVLAVLDELLSPRFVILRNDSAARTLEGLAQGVSIVKGVVEGAVRVYEDGLVFLADVVAGQKTGWYFDQRRNRAFVAALAHGGRVLDVFCYSGAFAIAVVSAGADEALAIDSSEPALDLGRRSAALNGVSARCTFRRADAFEALASLAQAGEKFRLVVVDPPAFAKSRKEVGSALKGYRKLARLAAAVVEAEGILLIASCSHNVEAAAFAAEVARGITRAGRSGRILRQSGAGPDHPVHLHLPETAYLKTLTIQLD